MSGSLVKSRPGSAAVKGAHYQGQGDDLDDDASLLYHQRQSTPALNFTLNFT
jgi:hypothetical protein